MYAAVEVNTGAEKNELASFRDLPGANPLVIVDVNCAIVYANTEFSETFLANNTTSIAGIDSEPNLFYFLKSFSKSNYSNFTLEFCLLDDRPEMCIDYTVNIERIFIKENEHFLLLFQSTKQKVKLEGKINNLHNALEYSNVPVIIVDETKRILYSTSSFEKILNTDIDVLYQNDISSALSVHFDKEDLDSIENAISENQKWNGMLTGLNSEGNVNFWELKLDPVFREENSVWNYIFTAHNITDYVLKNRISKRSEERLKSIINNVSDLLLILSKMPTIISIIHFILIKSRRQNKAIIILIPKVFYFA